MLQAGELLSQHLLLLHTPTSWSVTSTLHPREYTVLPLYFLCLGTATHGPEDSDGNILCLLTIWQSVTLGQAHPTGQAADGFDSGSCGGKENSFLQ